jgi:hypothetical protein
MLLSGQPSVDHAPDATIAIKHAYRDKNINERQYAVWCAQLASRGLRSCRVQTLLANGTVGESFYEPDTIYIELKNSLNGSGEVRDSFIHHNQSVCTMTKV